MDQVILDSPDYKCLHQNFAGLCTRVKAIRLLLHRFWSLAVGSSLVVRRVIRCNGLKLKTQMNTVQLTTNFLNTVDDHSDSRSDLA